MSESWNEVERVVGIVPRPCYTVTCRGCGKEFNLWFNGGELDQRECCGLRYSLVAPTHDFVVEARETAAQGEPIGYVGFSEEAAEDFWGDAW